MEGRGRVKLAALWAIGLHWKKVLFKEKTASTDGVVHDVEGPMESCFYHEVGNLRHGSCFWLEGMD